jgi:uncharacterized membrane protein
MRNVLLLASLAVNVFLIGLMAGGFLFSDGKQAGPQLRPDGPQHRIERRQGAEFLLPMRQIRDLPQEHREAARALIRERLPEARALRRDVRMVQNEISQLLASDPLDEQALEEALAAVNEKRALQQQHTTETFFLFLKNLPVEERRALLRRMGDERKMHRQKLKRKPAEEPPAE